MIDKTLENEYVYAEIVNLKPGELTIPVEYDGYVQYISPDESGAFQDGVAIPARMLAETEDGQAPEAAGWEIPESGDYRVVIDMLNKTVTIYSPENEFNENLVVEFKYQNLNHWIMTKTFTSGNYFIRTGTGWDGWSGKPYAFQTSLADSQLLVWSGQGSTIDVPAAQKFCIKTGVKSDNDFTVTQGPSTDTVDNGKPGNPSTDGTADYGARVLTIVPENAADAPLEMGKWLPFEFAVSNVGWTHDDVAKLANIKIDLRNKRIQFN